MRDARTTGNERTTSVQYGTHFRSQAYLGNGLSVQAKIRRQSSSGGFAELDEREDSLVVQRREDLLHPGVMGMGLGPGTWGVGFGIPRSAFRVPHLNAHPLEKVRPK